MGITGKKQLRHYIDKMEIFAQTVHITGWAIALSGDSVEYQVAEQGGKKVETAVRILDRPDASISVLGDDRGRACGFDLKFSCDIGKKYIFVITDGHSRIRTAVYPKELLQEQSRRFVSLKKMVRMTDFRMVKNDLRCLVKEGLPAVKKQWESRYETEENKYEKWLCRHRLTDMPPLDGGPLISIVVPVYRTPQEYLREMIESVQSQSYENWELCLADGSGGWKETEGILQEFGERDKRIRYQILDENRGIAGNTNAALSMARGEWVGLLDHDDVLEPSALYEVVRAINEHPEADVVYTDEDKVTMDLQMHFEPHLKPDFSPDLLRSNNYICHFFLVRRRLAERVGGLSSEYDGSQDYDFILKCTEQAGEIVHLPRILYHWRSHPASTAENPESKLYCFEAGKRALKAHLKRMDTEGTVELNREHPGYYHVTYPVKGEPLVSILIPNKDEKETLCACIRSIREKSTYRNYEIIILENNSETGEIRRYYRQLEDDGVRVVQWKGKFNFAAVNNFGVSHAKGEYLIFLNNDTEVIAPDWIEGMLGNCQRPEVGVVGAKLYYADGTVQHAGVVMKLAGVCGHVLCGLEGFDPGRDARAVVQQNYSAVTAACMMTKKTVFDAVSGFSEVFQVAYNDVDFCLKVREQGFLVVWNPRVELTHYESKSRGYETTPEKAERFEREKALLTERWPMYMEQGDPYYNPNLTLTAPDCSIDYEEE